MVGRVEKLDRTESLLPRRSFFMSYMLGRRLKVARTEASPTQKRILAESDWGEGEKVPSCFYPQGSYNQRMK